MERLRPTHAAATVLRQIRYTRIQLASHSQTQALHEELGGHFRAVKDASEQLDDAEGLAAVASRKVEYADALLDKNISLLDLEVLGLVGKDRKSSLYTRLFEPNSVTDIRRLPFEKQLIKVDGLIALLADPAYASLASRREKLGVDAMNLRQTLAERATRETARAAAEGVLESVLESARRAYNLMDSALNQVLGDDPDLVDTFFRPLRVRRKAQEDSSANSGV